ncbi:MAG: phosphoglycerate kinase [Candidatus Cloacimonetes bacterium 4572_65]|nr:MAG: phosphoglycerate kinase [Candidatus Cloacimonetes bacterium 4572_65]
MVIDGLPKIQDADLKDKLVLVRVDHNVVKDGIIKDTERIDATIPTLYNIALRGGKVILMTHNGRPMDRDTGHITVSESEAIEPIVKYIEHKLHIKISIPTWKERDDNGIEVDNASIAALIEDLKSNKIDMVYLPNTRWFRGEEPSNHDAEDFGHALADIADVYVNDAFGSWQPHASTMKPTYYMPSYSGILMQKEILHLKQLFLPKRPFVGIVAGSKFDTKIKPLNNLLEHVDYLILGGVVYNAYLAVKYDLKIKGISEKDLDHARDFVKRADQFPQRVVELPYIIESDVLGEKIPGKFRTRFIHDLEPGTELNYVLDVSWETWSLRHIVEIFSRANMFFCNAVMGFVPNFAEGTKMMYDMIANNDNAMKMFGGGDTLQEFKALNYETYLKAIERDDYYFFTGGGAVLNSIEQGSPFGMQPVQALIDNALKYGELAEKKN